MQLAASRGAPLLPLGPRPRRCLAEARKICPQGTGRGVCRKQAPVGLLAKSRRSSRGWCRHEAAWCRHSRAAETCSCRLGLWPCDSTDANDEHMALKAGVLVLRAAGAAIFLTRQGRGQVKAAYSPAAPWQYQTGSSGHQSHGEQQGC